MKVAFDAPPAVPEEPAQQDPVRAEIEEIGQRLAAAKFLLIELADGAFEVQRAGLVCPAANLEELRNLADRFAPQPSAADWGHP